MMMRYILAIVAMLAAAAGVGYVAMQFNKPVYGVFDGVGVANEGHYFLIEGNAYKSPANITLLHGKFILLGGYLLNGTAVKPKHVVAAYITGNVIVVSGGIQVVAGEVHKVGNYTVVTGNPARVFIVDGYLYHPK